MTARHRWSGVAALLLAASVLPLRTDGANDNCCNVTTSLASTINGPTAGDEAFFRLPSGPANLMLLLDNSGSMGEFPQCGDNPWDSSSTEPACKSPAISTPATPNPNIILYAVNGTCTPYSGAPNDADLQWIEQVVPTSALPDPGHTANALLNDHPTWGTGCTGNNCLFDPNATYFYGDWFSDAAHGYGSATRRATTAAGQCILMDSAGNQVRDADNNLVDMGPAGCTTCMTNHGYWFYKVKVITSYTSNNGSKSSKTTATYPSSSVGLVFNGKFLNANPPKFVTARKVVKDLAWIDPVSPSKMDQVRLGLTVLDSSGNATRGGKLVVPLGPDRTSSYPPTQGGFAPARQAIIDVLNTKKLDGTAVAGAFDPANGSTPLGSALFNIGQYFASPGLYPADFGSSNGYYNTPVSATNRSWERKDFTEKAAGTINAPWAGSTSNNCSICWGCQTNSIIVVTDGSPNSEINWPSYITSYATAAYTSAANCGNGCVATGTSTPAVAPRMAAWLHDGGQTHDLRYDTVMGGKQAINIHTVGFNITDPDAKNILRAIANMGGGTSQNAATSQQLVDAVWNAVNAMVLKENSFSAASASSLQTVQTAASEAFLTRFKPNESPAWEGHLFRAALFDEFLNGCDPTKINDEQPLVACGAKMVSANFNGDTDPATGFAVCSGVFLIDSDCDEIAEDTQTGDFVKKGQATAATFPWDAGAVLSNPSKAGYKSADETAANARNVFTWIGGARVDLKTSNVATLKPYLAIDAAWCASLLTQLGISGGTDPTTECAKQVIHFARGWDVTDLDGDGCAGPNNPKNTASCPSGTKGEERDRPNDSRTDKLFWKLGDIFHSSPAVVQAPIDEVRCDTGYEKQCVATLHSPSALPNQTSITSTYAGLTSGTTVDAYDRYRLDNRTRQRIVLVGANDGMLHAFDAGAADTAQAADQLGVYPYTQGNGSELWAFVPPDLLPRLKDMLTGHQYMVDGSPMVRDVWVDANADRNKTKDEYHTVAVFGERAGGTQYTALDITDPSSPTMLWTFPQPCSDDAKYMGQSWADFAPRPPPIGPVKIASSADPRGFTERWVVMINGGYDPALVQGRAVFMVDAWSGATLWRFTDDDFKSQLGFGARADVGAGTSMFPIPAAIGLSDIGDPSQPSSDQDGFFDTATWGDLGGNLFVARFQTPGTLDAQGRVTNWFAARTFEEQRRTDDLQGIAGRSEFFYMTSNALDPATRTLRTFVGSGNRERMMQQGPACGPDNLLACCQAGCTVVRASQSDSYGACNFGNQFTCQDGMLQRTATSTTAACGASVSCAASPGNAFTSNVTLHLECPGAGTVPDATAQVSCDSNGQCASLTQMGTGRDVTGTFNAPPRSRFYGVWAYGGDAGKVFSDAAGARVFDGNRFTDISYSGTCTGPTGGTCTLVDTTGATVTYNSTSPQLSSVACPSGVTSCTASGTDAGWFYEYGRVCPARSCPQAPPWSDEKTGSSATVVLGCAAWGGFRPYGQTTASDPCSGNVGTPLTYGYVADYLSGVPTSSCGYADPNGNVYRASPRSTTAPPTAATVRVDINARGQIGYSALNIDAGAPPASRSFGTRTDIVEPVYWLEVPRQLHACRHVSAASCE